jgi:hypothetical protein
MSHLRLIISMTLTCVLAAIANAIIARASGYNIYALKVGLIAPVGAALIGFAGASGAVFATRYFTIKLKWIDAAPMLMMLAATVALIHYYDRTLALDDSYKADELVDFRSYLDIIVTKAQPGARDDVDEGEYYLAAIELFGFVLGAAASLSLIRDTPKCAQCGAYLRKLKTATTPALSFKETTGALDLFEAGDVEFTQKLLAWRPEEQRFGPRSERATITYDLYACPKCKSEEIIVSVRAYKGRKWKEVPSLSARRNFAADLSLRDAFR